MLVTLEVQKVNVFAVFVFFVVAVMVMVAGVVVISRNR